MTAFGRLFPFLAQRRRRRRRRKGLRRVKVGPRTYTVRPPTRKR